MALPVEKPTQTADFFSQTEVFLEDLLLTADELPQGTWLLADDPLLKPPAIHNLAVAGTCAATWTGAQDVSTVSIQLLCCATAEACKVLFEEVKAKYLSTGTLLLPETEEPDPSSWYLATDTGYLMVLVHQGRVLASIYIQPAANLAVEQLLGFGQQVAYAQRAKLNKARYK